MSTAAATPVCVGIGGAFFPNAQYQKVLQRGVRGQGVLSYRSLSNRRGGASFRLIGIQDFATKLYLSKVD